MVERLTSAVPGTNIPSLTPKAREAETAREPSLGARFGEQLEKTRQLVEEAEASSVAMSKGDVGSVETILALSRAELAMRHVVSVRNRMIEAYNEVMRLPL